MKAIPHRNKKRTGPRVEVDARRVELGETDQANVTLLAGDPPMFRLEISLYSWERGDTEIEVALPHGGELGELLEWALPEQRVVICGNLRARIQEELAGVFDLLGEHKDSGTTLAV